ncbi:MAG TPA: hypothetical protein VGM56_33640 [Byssovorax sp.]|jgi:hypothetical protein
MLDRAARSLVVVFTLVAAPASVASAEPVRGALPVVLGEVSASASSPALPDAPALFRRDVEAELGRIAFRRSANPRRFTLSASLVRLESSKSDARAMKTSCVVSATLRDERGALLVVLEGRARAEDDPKNRADTERDALRVAVRSALTRLPEAVERAP